MTLPEVATWTTILWLVGTPWLYLVLASWSVDGTFTLFPRLGPWLEVLGVGPSPRWTAALGAAGEPPAAMPCTAEIEELAGGEAVVVTVRVSRAGRAGRSGCRGCRR